MCVCEAAAKTLLNCAPLWMLDYVCGCVCIKTYKDNITARYIISFSSYARRPHLLICINVALYVLIVNRIYVGKGPCRVANFQILVFSHIHSQKMTVHFVNVCWTIHPALVRALCGNHSTSDHLLYVHYTHPHDGNANWRSKIIKDSSFSLYIHRICVCECGRCIVWVSLYSLCVLQQKKNAMKRSIHIFWKKILSYA